MKICFTGTRQGMSDVQRDRVAIVFQQLRRPNETSYLLHGACHGADREAHPLVQFREMFPSNREQRDWANKVRQSGDIVHEINIFPIDRNHQTVDKCNAVVAAPNESNEVLRSGTWATIRYARKMKKPLYIVYPDGDLQKENVGD